jgi:hypothetical protein
MVRQPTVVRMLPFEEDLNFSVRLQSGKINQLDVMSSFLDIEIIAILRGGVYGYTDN